MCFLTPQSPIFSAVTSSAEETSRVGFDLGKSLSPNTILCLRGELGAGKTTFVKGLVRGVTGLDEDSVNSPTFVYLNIYEGALSVYHFDLYRLQDEEEFLLMGFDEVLSSGGISCIEWSERLEEYLPAERLVVDLEHVDPTTRKITITEVKES
jgi:tRNA threonylcarbamoyladenosine biosynthesis protein TsaE